jgi:hypothetical protein
MLYHRNQRVRRLVAALAIPVPQLYQIISFLAVFGLTALCPSGKRAELLEFGSCFLLLLIVAFPRNPEIFISPTSA